MTIIYTALAPASLTIKDAIKYVAHNIQFFITMPIADTSFLYS